MRSAGVYIGLGLPSDSVLFPTLQQDEALVGSAHYVFTLAFDENPSVFVFSDDQRLGGLIVLEEVE